MQAKLVEGDSAGTVTVFYVRKLEFIHIWIHIGYIYLEMKNYIDRHRIYIYIWR